MGEVRSIFAGGKLHRQHLDRIGKLESTTMNGRFVLLITLKSDDLRSDWLMDRVTYLFIVDIVDVGKKVLRAKCEGVHHFSGDPRHHACFDRFYDVETDEEVRLGEWSKLEVVFQAGEESKLFAVVKEETPEVKKTS